MILHDNVVPMTKIPFHIYIYQQMPRSDSKHETTSKAITAIARPQRISENALKLISFCNQVQISVSIYAYFTYVHIWVCERKLKLHEYLFNCALGLKNNTRVSTNPTDPVFFFFFFFFFFFLLFFFVPTLQFLLPSRKKLKDFHTYRP